MSTERIGTVRFWIELVVVGILTMLFGYVALYCVKMMYGIEMSEACRYLADNYVMEKTLFLTGALMYFVLELVGVNRWFCVNMLK